MNEEMRTRYLKRREETQRVLEEIPLLRELRKEMEGILVQLRDAYRVKHPDRNERDLLDTVVYEATFLLKREDDEPHFDTAPLENAVAVLMHVFGSQGMTRRLALGQIVTDAITESYKV